MHKCPECGTDVEDYRKFCSQSCATRFNNKLRVQNGTCNLLKKNGGSELASRHNKEMMKQGIHPFAKGNFSEETRKENGKKHSKWVREVQVVSGRHPWQLRESRINNECSREISIYSNSGVTVAQLYAADIPDNPEVIKIGITRDISMRENDGRFPIENPRVVATGDSETIALIERDVKLKFSTEDSFESYGSYEILEVEEADLISEVQRLSKSYGL